VQEARERVRSAIRNAGFEFPLRRITVNLAPADPRTTTLHASDSFRRSEVRRMRSLSRIGSSGSPPLTSQRRVGAEQWGSI
jgi:hypothetical protein